MLLKQCVLPRVHIHITIAITISNDEVLNEFMIVFTIKKIFGCSHNKISETLLWFHKLNFKNVTKINNF